MIQKLWDKLGEYLAVYVIVTLSGLSLRWLILKWKAGKDDRNSQSKTGKS